MATRDQRGEQRPTAFMLSAVRARIDAANAPCHGGTHIVMRLLATQRENLQAVSQEQSNRGDVTPSPAIWGALEIEA